ncbi:5-histidylcysteine sulfoxide synthase [Dolichospermum sp. LEGE 00240]|jgi:5-histidylcysteine sulfoxide synthase|uniref:5-histidylcysteine sulfoxide synthase n=1 Tax=Dolichospermum sp. LEGE 00240 TaxID=1828603 RepID=UPI001882F3C9|nr:5-histidylcysteine sulfoxide synthase [Dolichospermum sp. LEGE 00240]MDM3848228.1 5-histidylcysteine sulfoxide synthase [Aphanizomenon gracile PMC638.10]MDM3849612.1 5-histidylcysteine sulfoxide synthase [Aphanizomenon gracile PMC627.10]MDM3857906.1 5-histidylcysteine sulfoxide synthase [Aphanizomenon gracile PMC649.10]MDM3861755.1 5-histidylcysteine sulfoxide synthase [Aphanizomenon gracile PMC644.10]MBE9248668.1 5-histidylcysteine sulfoxide synthase [Dolichospermum sp. LEGE 00240]
MTDAPIPQLHDCSSKILLNYFKNSWEIEETLMKSVIKEETFDLNPDPLRNKLIFYLGHSAVFYINKLIQVGLIKHRINPQYETLFEIGVDPETPAELEAAIQGVNWPELQKVWEYRDKARAEITAIIHQTPLNLPIDQQHPIWALLMGIEHSRIHLETSSMLLRQLPIENLKRPQGWNYAPTNLEIPHNQMREIPGGIVKLGKRQDDLTFAWDSEYGDLEVEVPPFLASQYLITNGEFLEFVQADGYNNANYWHNESWQWKQLNNIQCPKFWIHQENNYRYRATFDELDLPLDWPVEVNHYEAIAYCRWKGKNTRLMTEAEWHQALTISEDSSLANNYNLNLQFISPTPVGMFSENHQSGLSDLRGNVWEWLGETFKPLPGFQTHHLYADQSAPFFDNKHFMMLGGSWATNGTMALPCYRNWFRPYFYQHVGFRVAESLD